MEISKIDCGAWLMLQPVDEKVGEVRLKMLPMPTGFQMPEDLKDANSAVKIFGPFIIGWNLESDGAAIPCTDETKAKYLPYLFRLEVKDDEGKESNLAILPIGTFFSDINNFLKN